MAVSPYHIIGDKDTVLGFSFAGVDGDAVGNEAEALAAYTAALKQPGLVILILTEQVASWLDDEVMKHKLTAKKPYVATIEDVWGKRERSRSLEQLIFEAVGVKILEQS